MATKNKIEKVKINEEMADDNRASVAMKPSTKSAAIAGMVSLMSGMKKDEVINKFFEMMQIMNSQVQASGVPNDAASKNQASVAMKGSVNEDIQEIFGGSEELTEEFKDKISTLFEAALESRIALEIQSLTEEFEASVEEKVNEKVEELTEQIDQYLNYVCEQWMTDNQVAIESALKVEIAEDFMGGLRNLFVENYIEVPENKIDIVEELYTELEELKSKLNETINDNIEMAEEIAEQRKVAAISEACEGLAVTDQHKFISLVENFSYDDKFEDKLKIVKEQHFQSKKVAKTDTQILSESFEAETVAPKQVSTDPLVNRVADSISRIAAKK